MALARIKKGDEVKIITGKHKGKTAAVQSFVGTDKVVLAGINERKRHHAANSVAPAGKRDVQLPIHVSNIAVVVDAKSKSTSRIGVTKKQAGDKVRVAKQAKNKEIK
jgi:large subunit ribosomal protein L24